MRIGKIITSRIKPWIHSYLPLQQALLYLFVRGRVNFHRSRRVFLLYSEPFLPKSCTHYSAQATYCIVSYWTCVSSYEGKENCESVRVVQCVHTLLFTRMWEYKRLFNSAALFFEKCFWNFHCSELCKFSANRLLFCTLIFCN